MCALERELTAITKKLEKMHPVEIVKYLNDLDNVPNRLIGRIRFNHQMREEMRMRKLNDQFPSLVVVAGLMKTSHTSCWQMRS